MEVVYKLWEGSWEDDAALRDRARGIFADPAKVHRIRHEGNNYRVDAIHLCEPSPQRTPVLYQAGTSPRGRQFAAEHAECVFMSGPSAKIIAPRVAAIRELAAKAGRNPAEILMFSMFTIILGRTEAEAKAKYADYRSHISPEGALTLMSGWTGVDFSTYDLDQQVRHVENDAGRTAMDNITRADPDRVWTVREVAQHVGIGGIGPVVVGTPEKVADAIEAWFDQTDVDGLNVPFAVSPGDFEDISDMLVPELARRGRYKEAYRPGTLREKLFGAGRARLAAPHPAAQYRPAWRRRWRVASAQCAMRTCPHRRVKICTRARCVSHRPGMTAVSHRPVNHDLDQFRAGPAERRRQRGLQILRLGDPHRLQPERFGHAGKIDRRIDEIHADIMIVAMKREQPLLDDAVAAIVGDHDRQRQLVMRRGP